MSRYYFVSVALISFIFLASFLSCSSYFLPLNVLDVNDNDHYSSLLNNNDEIVRILPVHDRSQRSAAYYPRASRNTWFRVSTYQHFKPAVSEETSNGDNLLRWGR